MGVESTKYFLVGGYPYDQTCYVYDESTGEWTDDNEITALPESVKGPYCGYAVDTDGKEFIVVAGGWTTAPSRLTFVYDIEANSWTADNTPEYPRSAAFNGMSVPYEV